MKDVSMRRAFLLFFAALIIAFLIMTWPFAKAAFLAFTLAIIFSPFNRWIRQKLKLPRYVAASMTSVIVWACIIFPLSIISALLVTKLGQYFNDLTAQLHSGALEVNLGPLIGSVHGWMERVIGTVPTTQDIQSALMNILKAAAEKFYELSPRVLSTTATVTANLFFIFLFLIVFLAEGQTLHQWLKETIPLSKAHWDELVYDIRLIIASSLAAGLIIGLVQGTLLGAGFWVAGFHPLILLWLMAIIVSIIPVVGAASCYVGAAVYLASSGNMKGAIFFLIFGIAVVSMVDNILRPFIVRGSARIHPILLFVILVGAIHMMGPIGLFVGPVFLVIFLASLRIYRREFADLKGTSA